MGGESRKDTEWEANLVRNINTLKVIFEETRGILMKVLKALQTKEID